MKDLLKRVEELIPVLPEKDAKLCMNYLSKRDFESILEIVESDIYKAKRKNIEELPDEYISDLLELKDAVATYLSYLEIPSNSEDYDYY